MSDVEETISGDEVRRHFKVDVVINLVAASLFLAGLAAIILVVFYN